MSMREKKDNNSLDIIKLITSVITELRDGIQESLTKQIYQGIRTVDMISKIEQEKIYEIIEDEEVEEEAKRLKELFQKADKKQKEAVARLFSLQREDLRSQQRLYEKIKNELLRQKLQAYELLLRQGIPKVYILEGKINLKLKITPEELEDQDLAKRLEKAAGIKKLKIKTELPKESSEDYNCEVEIRFKVDV